MKEKPRYRSTDADGFGTVASSPVGDWSGRGVSEAAIVTICGNRGSSAGMNPQFSSFPGLIAGLPERIVGMHNNLAARVQQNDTDDRSAGGLLDRQRRHVLKPIGKVLHRKRAEQDADRLVVGSGVGRTPDGRRDPDHRITPRRG